MIDEIIQKLNDKIANNCCGGFLLKKEFKEILEAHISYFESVEKSLFHDLLNENKENVQKVYDKKNKIVADFTDLYNRSEENTRQVPLDQCLKCYKTLDFFIKKVSKYILLENIVPDDYTLFNTGLLNLTYSDDYKSLVRLRNSNGLPYNNEDFYVKLFIISNKYFVRLTIGMNGLFERIEQIIQRDIKKLIIVNEKFLEVHFHGIHKPEVLELEDYAKALELQKNITQKREFRK